MPEEGEKIKRIRTKILTTFTNELNLEYGVQFHSEYSTKTNVRDNLKMQVVLSFILCVFIPTCIGRTKLANCSKNPYQEHICAVYNCTKLEELTKTESSVEPDTSVCLILRNESDYEGLEIFPNR